MGIRVFGRTPCPEDEIFFLTGLQGGFNDMALKKQVEEAADRLRIASVRIDAHEAGHAGALTEVAYGLD
ncbi:MAG TPA: hypothetical protein VJ746_02975 [Nitrospira sp.]|nr:hypothetical protein [Nitrospira sp.]